MADVVGQHVLFSGCASERRGRPARHATIALAKDLHIELWEAPIQGCCGARADRRVSEAARQRALAPLFEGAARGLDIACLSPACQCVVAAQVAADKSARTARRPLVRTFTGLLAEQYGRERLARAVPSGLSGLRVAVHSTCHGDHNPPRGVAARPSLSPASLMTRLLPWSRRADDPVAAMQAAMGPVTALSSLVAATGAVSVGDASAAGNCQAYPLLKRTAPFRRGSGSAPCLAAAARAGVDVLVTPCFLCFMGLNSYQRGLPAADPARSIPVLHLSQLLGVACEVAPNNLDLSNTTASARRALATFVV